MYSGEKKRRKRCEWFSPRNAWNFAQAMANAAYTTVCALLIVRQLEGDERETISIKSNWDIAAVAAGIMVGHASGRVSFANAKASTSNIMANLRNPKAFVPALGVGLLKTAGFGLAVYYALESESKTTQVITGLIALLFLFPKMGYETGQTLSSHDREELEQRMLMFVDGRKRMSTMQREAALFAFQNWLKIVLAGMGSRYLYMITNREFSTFTDLDKVWVTILALCSLLLNITDYYYSYARLLVKGALKQGIADVKFSLDMVTELEREIKLDESQDLNIQIKAKLRDCIREINKRTGLSGCGDIMNAFIFQKSVTGRGVAVIGREAQLFSGTFLFFMTIMHMLIPAAKDWKWLMSVFGTSFTFIFNALAIKPILSQNAVSHYTVELQELIEKQKIVSRAVDEIMNLVKGMPPNEMISVKGHQSSAKRSVEIYCEEIKGSIEQQNLLLKPNIAFLPSAAAQMEMPLLAGIEVHDNQDEHKGMPDNSINLMLQALPKTLDIRGGKITLGQIISYLEIPRYYIHARKRNHRCLMVGYRDYLVLYLFNLSPKLLFNQTIYYKAPYLAMTQLPLEFERSKISFPTHFIWGGTRAGILNIIAPLFEELPVA